MSDFFIKTGSSGSTGWRKMSNLFVKTAGSGSTGWKKAIGIWLKNTTSAGWLKVWPLSGVFASRAPWIATSTSTTYANRLTTSDAMRIGSVYYGNNAQWDANGWTITGYLFQWRRYVESGAGYYWTDTIRSGTPAWTATTGQDTLPSSIWTTTNADLMDGAYFKFFVQATASNSTYNGNAESALIKVVRQQPRLATGGDPSLNKYNPNVGDTLSYSSGWDTSVAYKPDASRSTIKWYKNSISSTSGGTIVQDSTSNPAPSSPYSYVVQSSDLGYYIYAVEEVFNTGTDFDLGTTVGVKASVITTSTVQDVNYQLTGSQRRIDLPSAFTKGTTLYISTNGYINWGGNDPGGSISLPDSGITLAPLAADLRQGIPAGNGTNASTGGLWVYGDETNFYVRFEGNYYNDYAQLADYQVKFYWNQSYADVYFINNNLTTATPSPTAVKNGANVYKTWGQSTSQTSTLISTSLMKKYTAKDGVDDDRTAITADIPPGNISNVVLRNFTTGNAHLFLTTGTNTNNVKYTYTSIYSSSVTSGELTYNTSSSSAYQITTNLLSLLTLRTWNSDTYSGSDTYFNGYTVWYAGNQYQARSAPFSGQTPSPSGSTTYWTRGSVVGTSPGTARTYSSTTTYRQGDTVTYGTGTTGAAVYSYTANDPGFSGVVPTNTSYWTKIQTITYSPGDYVYYAGGYYFCKSSIDGVYPTNTTYWNPTYHDFQLKVTPYNGTLFGTEYTHTSNVSIRPDTNTDFVAISVAPVISARTSSSISAKYTPSIYTNVVVTDVKYGNPLTSVFGYPYNKNVSGATEYTEAPTGLTADTRYYFYFTPRYQYTSSVYYDGVTASIDEKTLPNLSAPTISSVTFASTSSVTVNFSGGSGPYYQIFWNTTGVAPSNSATFYDAASTSSPLSETISPTDESTYYFWIRSSTENKGNTTSSGNGTSGTFSDWSANAFSLKFLAKPTSLSATTNNSTKITLTWSGGAGPNYQAFWYGSPNARPTDKQASFDFSVGATSPYDWTGMSRGSSYYLFIRANNGTDYTNWHPATTPGVLGRAPYYAPPTPTITNSAQTSNSLSWYWDQPTPNSTQDQPSSWDYAISTSTSTPTSWTNLTTRPTSSSPLVTGSLSANTDYYLHVRAKNDDASATTYQSGRTSAATTLYTVTFNTNGASGSPSVSSVTQTTQGGSVTLATKGTMSSTGNIFGGWRTGTSSGTQYAFGASFTPTSDITLYAYYGATPTCSAPSANFSRWPTNTSSNWEYYSDYPTPSGAYSSISSMEYEIYTTQTGSTLIAGGSGTLAYPTGGDLYPYLSQRNQTWWSFRVASGEGGRVATTASRWGRFRVKMIGIDGLTYNGTWTARF